VKKYGTAIQATDENIIWRIREYRHTLRIFNSYCFFTATIVTGTRLNVTLHVHCLSC